MTAALLVSIRIPLELLEEIDALVVARNKEQDAHTHVRHTRSSVVNEFISLGLQGARGRAKRAGRAR